MFCLKKKKSSDIQAKNPTATPYHTLISQTALLIWLLFPCQDVLRPILFFKCSNFNKITDQGKELTQIRCGSFCPVGKRFERLKTKQKQKPWKGKKIILIYYSCYSERSSRKQNQQLICQAEKMQSHCWLLWSIRLFYGGSLSNSIHFTWLQIP